MISEELKMRLETAIAEAKKSGAARSGQQYGISLGKLMAYKEVLNWIKDNKSESCAEKDCVYQHEGHCCCKKNIKPCEVK